MNHKQKLVLLLAAVMALLLLAGCGQARTPEVLQTIPPEAGTQPPTEPPVQIVMGEYELRYSGTLKDVLRWTEVSGGLAFTVTIGSGEYPVFTMRYDSDQGDLVTVLTDAAGNKIPVAFQMDALPASLSEEDAAVFYAAQEAVNEVVASLTLK